MRSKEKRRGVTTFVSLMSSHGSCKTHQAGWPINAPGHQEGLAPLRLQQ